MADELNAAELRRLHEAATAGPWVETLDAELHAADDVTRHIGFGLRSPSLTLFETTCDPGNYVSISQARTDRGLVCCLRNNTPAILALIEERDRLRMEVAKLRGHLQLHAELDPSKRKEQDCNG